MKYNVPFIKPELPDADEISDFYQKIVDSNWFSNFGPLEQELCKGIEKYIGSNISATTVSNATSALMLALKALLPSDRKGVVLMPAFTFAAGAEAIEWCGHEPVFIDIDKNTWQPDLKQAESYILQNRKNVVGILFCNIFGVGDPNIEAWEKLAQELNLPLIIDSAAGFGSEYEDGSKLGTKGDCEIFSFHVTKPFGVGEGGAVTGKSKELIEKIRSMSNFGFDKTREVINIGFNGKMQEINAAIGLWQLERIDERIERHQKNLAEYKELLYKHGFKFQNNQEKSSVCFVSALAPNHEIADKLFNNLINDGIQVNRYYNPPLQEHRAFSAYKLAKDLKNTKEVCRCIVSFPSHTVVNEEIIEKALR